MSQIDPPEGQDQRSLARLLEGFFAGAEKLYWMFGREPNGSRQGIFVATHRFAGSEQITVSTISPTVAKAMARHTWEKLNPVRLGPGVPAREAKKGQVATVSGWKAELYHFSEGDRLMIYADRVKRTH